MYASSVTRSCDLIFVQSSPFYVCQFCHGRAAFICIDHFVTCASVAKSHRRTFWRELSSWLAETNTLCGGTRLADKIARSPNFDMDLASLGRCSNDCITHIVVCCVCLILKQMVYERVGFK